MSEKQKESGGFFEDLDVQRRELQEQYEKILELFVSFFKENNSYLNALEINNQKCTQVLKKDEFLTSKMMILYDIEKVSRKLLLALNFRWTKETKVLVESVFVQVIGHIKNIRKIINKKEFRKDTEDVQVLNIGCMRKKTMQCN